MNRSSLPWLALSFVTSAGLAAACGADPGNEVFGGASGVGGGTGQGGSTTTSNGAAGEGNSSGEGGSPSTTSSNGPGPSSSSSAGGGGSGSSMMMSSSSGMTSTSVPCGGSECDVEAGDGCCWDAYRFFGPPQAECVPAGGDACQIQGGETMITCAGPDDCDPGQICCADREFFQNQTFYITLACHSSCDWPDVTMCDPGDPNFPCPVVQTMMGPVQTVCQQSQILPSGYFVCGLN